MHTRSQRLLALALVFVCQEIVAAEVRTDATVTKAGYREGPLPGKQWKMVWNDEFGGAALDTGKWSLMSLLNWTWPGTKTREEKSNLFLDGQGALVIRLTKDPDGTVCYAKGVQSKFRKAYGYYETRVKFSKQPGCVVDRDPPTTAEQTLFSTRRNSTSSRTSTSRRRRMTWATATIAV